MERGLPSRRLAGRPACRSRERDRGQRGERRIAARCRAPRRGLAQRADAPLRQQGRAADGLRGRGIPAAGRVRHHGGSSRRCRRRRCRAGRNRPGLRPVRGRPPSARRGHVPAGRAPPRQCRVRRRQRGGLRASHRDRGALPRGRAPARAFSRSGRGQRVVARARPLRAVDQRALGGAHRRAGPAATGRSRVRPIRRGRPAAVTRAGRITAR